MPKPRTFYGGIHPEGRKYFTEKKPVEDMPAPSLVIIPMQQHTGAACEPLVKPGDDVNEGQKIGDSKSFVSAPVHASISGKVTVVEPRPHPAFPKDVLSVIIERDAAYVPQPAPDATQPGGLSAQQIKDKIRESGVVGLGGAAFPTHVKLSPPPDKKIDAVILNGVECEPYLTNDHRLMLERAGDVLGGLGIILKVLGVSRAYIGIESNKPDAIKAMSSSIAGLRPDAGSVEVVPLKVKYPQGAEKQLIKAVLGRSVPSGKLPFDVGVVVQNVGTALAVYEAVAMGRPLTERVITVTGEGIKEPKNLRVRIGTPFSRVIEYCGGLNEGVSKVIMGGPMMGLAQYTLDVPVVKGTSGILALTGQEEGEEGPCIKCGRCVDACPMRLMPNHIGDYAKIDNFERCREYRILDCMECGACAYECASRRPLVHLIKYAKSRIAAAARK